MIWAIIVIMMGGAIVAGAWGWAGLSIIAGLVILTAAITWWWHR